MSKERLEAYLKEKGITSARILTFERPTITVEDAEKQLGISREKIIKSMIFIDENGVPVIGIVTGDKMVDEEKLTKACGAKRIKIARPSAVKNLTGYEVGAMPPIGFKKPIRTFIDPKVLSFDKVYGGGGAINALLEIDTQDVKKLVSGKVVDISR